MKIRIGDIAMGGEARRRATVTQQKTGRPVQFEITETARESLATWFEVRGGSPEDFPFSKPTDPVRYLGVDVKDALNLAEDTDV